MVFKGLALMLQKLQNDDASFTIKEEERRGLEAFLGGGCPSASVTVEQFPKTLRCTTAPCTNQKPQAVARWLNWQ